MPDKTDIPLTTADKTALYALFRFIVSITALVVLGYSDLHNNNDAVPMIVYLLIGGLNGVDIYNLVKAGKNTS